MIGKASLILFDAARELNFVEGVLGYQLIKDNRELIFFRWQSIDVSTFQPVHFGSAIMTKS